MSPNLHMNSGGVARDNDFSTHTNSQTTNHIYLHPGLNQREFDNWMRQIGSLLQVAPAYTALKPTLELIIATFAPKRLFLISHAALPEFDVDAYIEILVVMEGNRSTSKQLMKNFLKMACFQQRNVFVNFETAFSLERGISKGHPHYCAFCKEEFLVFSGSPYRLPMPSVETMDELKAELPERFNQLILQSEGFLVEAQRLIENQSANLAALMLHQCLEYLYKNILFIYDQDFYKSHRLGKLQPKVGKFFPQLCTQIDETTIYLLDSTHDSITAPFYDVGEIWNAQGVFKNVECTLKSMRSVFEMRMRLLFGDNK